MYEHQFAKVFELVDAEVSSAHRLCSFLSSNTDSDVSLLNHRNIIASISNGRTYTDALAPHVVVDNVTFLLRRELAADDALAIPAEFKEVACEPLRGEDQLN